MKMSEGKDRFFYNEFADHFDKVVNMYDTDKRIKIVFKDLLPMTLNNKKVLDAGCGTGWFSKVAVEEGGDVVSLDIGINLLKKVDKKCNSKKVNGDLLNLPFSSDSFDIVICSEAIEHTLSPKDAFKELVRVLAIGGILVLTVPNKFWFWSVWLANKLKLRPYEGIENWCSWKDLRSWSKEYRVVIDNIYGFHLFPFVFSFTNGILDYFDRYNHQLGPYMVNIAFKAFKKG